MALLGLWHWTWRSNAWGLSQRTSFSSNSTPAYALILRLIHLVCRTREIQKMVLSRPEKQILLDHRTKRLIIECLISQNSWLELHKANIIDENDILSVRGEVRKDLKAIKLIGLLSTKAVTFDEIINVIKKITGTKALIDHLNELRVFEEIAEKLRNHYKKRFSERDYTFLSSADVWVNRTLSKGKETLKSDDYLKIIKEGYQKDNFLLLLGQGGEGKTMTVRRLASDWTEGKLPEFDLVFCIPLRDIQEESASILDIALLDMQLRGVLKQLDMAHIQKIRPNMVAKPKTEQTAVHEFHLLIILDGFCEFSADAHCEELYQVLYSREQPSLDYCVLVTSRPYAVEDARTPAPKFCIEPLDEEQQGTYVHQYFQKQSVEDASEKLSEVVELLAQNPNLEELAETPLMLYFICILVNVLKPTDTTVHLYRLLFNMMVEEHEYDKPAIRKSHSTSALKNVQSLEATVRRLVKYPEQNLHNVFKQDFAQIGAQSPFIHNLSQMALTGLIGDTGHAPDKLQFTETDLNGFSIDGHFCTKVGLLNVHEGTFKTRIYEFPHKSIQAFFAALALVYEISLCKEIKISQDPVFPSHPLLSQILETTKDTALEQFFCFFLEMAADYWKFNEQLLKNCLSYFLTWIIHISRIGTTVIFLSPSTFRVLVRHLPHCSDECELYLRTYLLDQIWQRFNFQTLLTQLYKCNIAFNRVDNLFLYIPILDTVLIMDQSSLKPYFPYAVPMTYTQMKEKCDNELYMCILDLSAWHVFPSICKKIGWKDIAYLKINIAGTLDESQGANTQFPEEQLHADAVFFNFEDTVQSPFDFLPIWNGFFALFAHVNHLRLESNSNDLMVNGLVELFSQRDLRSSLQVIQLWKIAFPNDQAVGRVADQLKHYKSLVSFSIRNNNSLSEKNLLALLKSVKDAKAEKLYITEDCLHQLDTFKKFCSLLKQWHHLHYLSFGGIALPANFIDMLCDTVTKMPQIEVLYFAFNNEVKNEHIGRLKDIYPHLSITHD